jgi:aspartokinase/homoserine dehydrogenase 1
MKVLKFGGTSVGTVDSIKTVIDILENNIANGKSLLFFQQWVASRIA